MISEINILLRTLKSHDLVGRRANIAKTPIKIFFRTGLDFVYCIWDMGPKNCSKLCLNLAFFVTMSNFFPNTLYEIYLDVLVIGEV